MKIVRLLNFQDLILNKAKNKSKSLWASQVIH